MRERARAAGRPITRAVLIETGQQLRREGGPGVLAVELVERLEPRAVVDSVRHPAEVEVLRSLDRFRLLGVDAPVEVRWRRAVARAREGEIDDLEAFRRREQRENQDRPESQQLLRTLALADHVLDNRGDVEELRAQVNGIVERWEQDLRGG